jgi:hypothetical protein
VNELNVGTRKVSAALLQELTDARNVNPLLWVPSTSPESSTLVQEVKGFRPYWRDVGFQVRTLRGSKCEHSTGFFDEICAALKFPYFGENWDALDDCMSDLLWLAPGAGYVLWVRDAELLLAADLVWIPTFVSVIINASLGWAGTVTVGATAGRPAVPFHMVLESSSVESLDPTIRKSLHVIHPWTGAQQGLPGQHI